MKLIYITPYYKPSWYFGGPPRCISEQAELLHKNYGYQIDVITLNLNGNKKLFDTKETVIKDVEGVTVHYLPHTSTPFFNYFFSSKLYDYQKKLKDYDGAHIHGLFNAFSSFGMKMAADAGVPYIVTPHGMLDKWCIKKSGTAKFLHSYLFEKRLLIKANIIHFTTISEKNNSVFPKGIKASIIPYLINFDTILPQEKYLSANTDKIKAVFWGRINPKKGLLLFIEAISGLTASEKEKLAFDIYGNEEENHLREITHLITKYGLQSIITYKGFLDPVKRDKVIKSYDVMILTSFQENFGITVLEALQHQLPVFISDKVNVADWIQKYDCGWVTFMDRNSIRNDLRQLIESGPEKVRLKGRNNLQLFKSEMDIIKLLPAYKEMYEELLR